MNKILYVVRHGKAEGQEPDARLTLDGQVQAQNIADTLASFGIDRIVSSTYRRAIDSIQPLAERLGLPVETDERIIEAGLSSINYPDWLERLKATFEDPDLSYEGGESSRAAAGRAVAAVDAVLLTDAQVPVVVTHGRLLTLLMRHYDSRFGFDNWRALSSPDLFRIHLSDSRAPEVARLWK